MRQFRYDVNDRYDIAFVEMWNGTHLVARLTLNRAQLEARIAELKDLRMTLGNKAYVDPQTNVSLNPDQLEWHIRELNRLRVLLRCTPYIDPQTGVNLEKPPISARPEGHREAGPAHGGPGSDSGGAAWQGFGDGPGAGGGGGGQGP